MAFRNSISSKFATTFLAAALVSQIQVVTAQATSLYIPGFDPQPVTILSELGVGADGATTWLVAPGTPSGDFQDSGFFGPATVISGPNGAEVIYNDAADGLLLDEKCAISGTVADCTAVAVVGGSTATELATERVAPFEVQGGGPTAAPTAGSSSSAPSSSSVPSAGSSASTGPSPTFSSSLSSPSTSPSTSPQNNGASTTSASLLSAFAAVFVFYMFAL